MVKTKPVTLAEDNKSEAFNAGAKAQREAIGSSGTEITGGYFSEEYLNQLRGSRAADVWDKMRRSETQVAMLLAAVSNPIKAAHWAVEPSEHSPEYEKQAELVRAILFDSIDWQAFLHEALTLVPFGFAVFEQVHSVVLAHPKFGTFNGLKSLGFRSQKTIEEWKLEKKTGRILSVKQQAQGDVADNAEIPGEFLLVFSNLKEGDNYEGISALRPMYGAYTRKQLYLKLTAIGVEKYAVGTPIGTVPSGKEKGPEVEEFKRILAAYTSHEKAYITKPEGWEIEIQKVEFDATKIVELLKFENTEMVNALVANFLALGTNGGGGAFALSNDLSDFFLTGIESYANLIVGVINRVLIPNLVKLNFGEQPSYPKLAVSGISDKAGKELAEIVQLLVASKTVTPDMPLEEFLRAQYRLPKPDVTTDVTPAPGVSPEANAAAGANVQQTALNGAQVTSLVTILQNVAAGLMPRDSGVNLIQTAFNVDTATAEKILGTAGGSFKISPELLQAARVQLSEKAAPPETPYTKQFDASRAELKALMQKGLGEIASNLKKKVASSFKGASDANKILAGTKAAVDPAMLAAYKTDLRDALAKAATAFEAQARAETKKGPRKLVDPVTGLTFAAPQGAGFYAALPEKVRKLIEAQAILVGDSQAADLEKVVSFSFTSAATSTEEMAEIEAAIDAALAKALGPGSAGGMSVDTAAGDAVAHVAQAARVEHFFSPEVFNEIESFTFVNGDPVSTICQELAGKTFGPNDPRVDEFQPPMHHNCKSILAPNLKGTGAPEVSPPFVVSDEARKSITLIEK